jgi:glycopeptide antibiotics resistance protein
MGRADVSLHPTERPGASRRFFFFVALFSLVFIAYGSLVPLDFQAVPIDEAWQRFLVPFDRPLSLGSRVDVATNVLLTIPLAFFLLGAVWPDKPGWARLFVSGLVWLSCLFVSFAVEFAQIFFSGRTPSASDVLAQTVGALIGIGLWYWQGQGFSVWLRGWQRARGQRSLAERFLWVYVAVLFGYGLLPLDLTLSPVDLYQKWSAGRVNLLPFAFQSQLRMQDVYDLVTDVLLWVPVSYLWITSGKKGRKQAWMWSAMAAVALELGQLIVFSRVTDVTDIGSAWLGAFIGVILARPPTTDRISRHSRSVYFQTYLGFLGFALYALALAAIFWYPFDFNFERSFLRDQASSFFGTPLHAYYVSTPFRAVTEVLHKTLFFVPLGIAFAFARLPFEASRYRRLFDVAAVAAIGLVAAGIELGQMALVDKHAGSTDLVLEWMGGVLGYVGLVFTAGRWMERPAPTATTTTSSEAPLHTSPSVKAVASRSRESDPGDGLSTYAQLQEAYAPYLQARPAANRTRPEAGHVARAPHRTSPPPQVGNLLPYTTMAAAWMLLIAAAGLLPMADPPLLPLALQGGVVAVTWAVCVTVSLVLASRLAPGLPMLAAVAGFPRKPVVTAGVVYGLIALLPLQPDAVLADAFTGSFGRPEGRIYLLIKALILWVPLGVIGSIAGVGQSLGRWGVAGAATFLLLVLPMAGDMLVKDFYEVFAAPLGIGLGQWLAKRVAGAATGARSEAMDVQRRKTRPAPAASESLPVAGQGTVYEAAFGQVQEVPPAPSRPSSAAPRGSVGYATLPHALSLGLLLPIMVWAWAFPAVGPALAATLLLYYAVALRYPVAVLVVVPWALPSLDLAPWTGRFFFDEFDLVLLASLAAAIWHWPPRRSRARPPPLLGYTALLFGLSCLVAALVGLWPLQEIDQNAFSTYRSQYNALRIGKGFLLAALLAWLLFQLPMRRDWQAAVLTGTSLGLVSVGLVTLWERTLFASLWDFSTEYRVMATFSSMHVGGAHIEAYTILALPLAAHFLRTAKRPWQLALATAALVLGSYVLVSTVARGALLGLVAVVLTLGIGSWFQRSPARPGSGLRKLTAAGALLAAAGVLVLGIGGTFFQERLGRSFDDLETRLEHWGEAIHIMDDGLGTALLGMGLGQFPQTYLLRTNPDTPPGSYRFTSVGDNTFLALGSGETLYFTQRVGVRPGTRYRLSLRVRSGGGEAKLNTTLCERHLSHSRRCVWPAVLVPGDGQWHDRTLEVDSGVIGLGDFPVRAPVDFALYNSTRDVVVMVDDLQLTGPDGGNLLSNGGFEDGAEHWFIKTHEHLSWHVKNLWVATYFDQGLIGVMLFTLLSLLIIATLVRGIRSGSRFALAVLAGLMGFLAIGTVGSLFDAPRLTLLYFGLSALGVRHLAGGRRHA